MKRGGPLKRGVQLKRSSLKRKTQLRRGGRLRPVSKRKRAERFERDFGGIDKVRWTKSHACATCHDPPPSEASHIKSRGAGGTSCDIIPQCSKCHRLWHDLGRLGFCEKYQLSTEDLRSMAWKHEQDWQAFSRARVLEGGKHE